MESWGNARFQAKSHVREKSESATYGQDITPAILNGFGDKEIFHHTAKRLLPEGVPTSRFLSRKFRRIFDDDGTQ